MTITANQVKELREITGLGMMECKAALTECNGNQNAAIDLLRKKAGSKVEKKAGRTAAEGAIGMSIGADRKLAAMVEVNSETDFVAKGDDFIAFAHAVAATAAKHNSTDVDTLNNAALDTGASVSKAREALVMKLGENINVRRFVRYQSSNGHIGAYVHGRKIGVLVELEGGDANLARDLAMHIAASRPECVHKDQVPADIIAKEREIFSSQAASSGKPPEIVEKMVLGRINKFLSEITLLGQPFVKDPETTVEKLLKAANAKVLRFTRYEVGEGMDRKSNDFVAEVMAQVKG